MLSKSASFNAGVRRGMEKEALNFSGIAGAARGMATRAAPFVANHVNPMMSAMHAGSAQGAGGMIGGAESSAMNTFGQALKARGGKRVVNLAKDGAGATRIKNPALHRLGKTVSTLSPAAEAAF